VQVLLDNFGANGRYQDSSLWCDTLALRIFVKEDKRDQREFSIVLFIATPQAFLTQD